MSIRSVRSLHLLVAALLLSACASAPASDAPPAPPGAASAWADARQLVLVTTPDWDATQGSLRRVDRDGEAWREVGAAVPITVGRTGLAWGAGLHPAQADGPSKREGDGKAPAGAFRIGPAFGYAPTAATTLPYLPMTATHWCMDVAGSPLYNRIVDSREVGEAAVAGSTEPMRRDVHAKGDQRYRLGFVIEHNADGRDGAGSCIFAHLWKAPGEATAGCTAMAEPAMLALTGWLQPSAHPVIVQLTDAEHRRLRADWRLPDPTD
jgi:L,D-peptidoglycan transpeptidase YkuD (ErfK/YbiS/YcfS/YnhG family)